MVAVKERWRIWAWEVSIPPSRAWSQLHSCTTLVTWRCVSGTCVQAKLGGGGCRAGDRKSKRLNFSHSQISYAVFCLEKKNKENTFHPTIRMQKDRYFIRVERKPGTAL